MQNEPERPIIIKRKKVVAGDGHHGGAWKVAYADFVTAMMAFFLLMWLLNATTEQQRKGLADYFSPTIPMAKISGGGDGSFWGDSVFSEENLAQNGSGASNLHPTEYNQAMGNIGTDRSNEAANDTRESTMLEAEQLLETLKARGGESMAALMEQRHVVTRLSDLGLVVEIFDTENARLFIGETAEPTRLLRETMAVVAEVAALVSNDVAIHGHVAARPVVMAENPVWQLSSARADTGRSLLETSGITANRMQRVTGYADRKPSDPNPMSQRNSRIEIVLLREGL